MTAFVSPPQISGLDKHQTSSARPLSYNHIDAAGSSGDLPGVPTASALVAIVMTAIKGSKQ